MKFKKKTSINFKKLKIKSLVNRRLTRGELHNIYYIRRE